jgi:hypothetical protein
MVRVQQSASRVIAASWANTCRASACASASPSVSMPNAILCHLPHRGPAHRSFQKRALSSAPGAGTGVKFLKVSTVVTLHSINAGR